MGTLSRIAISTLSHRRVNKDRIRTDSGVKTVDRWIESRPLAAAYGAVQHFIGERDFDAILFRNGLPWIFTFHGLNGNPDDGTVVVVGDLASLFQKSTPLFRSVRSLAEARVRSAVQGELAAMPAGDPRREQLSKRLAEPLRMDGAMMTLNAAGKPFTLYDFYGNPVAAQDGRIVIPLNDRGFFLRGDPQVKGSFQTLLTALRQGTIVGLEPVEIIAYDMTVPIEARPMLRLRLTSMYNQPIRGRLQVTLGNLALQYSEQLAFAPRQQQWVDVQVSGRPRTDNSYPLSVTFDAGPAGVAAHQESMHVNWISRRTITVDGHLDDWAGTIPQTIRTDVAAEPSFEQSMWMPFEKFPPGRAGGFAVAYVAYDDRYFYFAAKIADDMPHPGTVRFATPRRGRRLLPASVLQPPGRKEGRAKEEPNPTAAAKQVPAI